MSYVGAILITVSAALIGFSKAYELKKSVETLSELVSLLELLRNEICTRRTPMKQVLSTGFISGYKHIKPFVLSLNEHLSLLGNKSFSQIWAECIADSITNISDESRSCLVNLGSSLGRYDAQLQAASIDRCISELEHEYKSIYQNLKSNQKMYIGLAAGMGLIVSIILI